MTTDPGDSGATTPRKAITEAEGPHAPDTTDALFERLRAAAIGEYELYGELGRGGMAAVYLAHDIALDRKVAIKVMLPELLSGAGMVERFKREARTAGALSHPHIIPIFAVRDQDGMLYFVMKFVEGRGLDSIIKELGPLPLAMVQTILSQVAGALAHAHRKNVIHRDIKPANVMIDEDGWAVVTDFGIAKVQDAANLTTTGAAIGTPYYMSPEQGSGRPVTGASDQYSLGIMAYEMLTGKTPFTGPSMMEVMSGHFFDTPEPLRNRRPDCPRELENVVMKMLAKEPAARYPSLDDVVAAIAAPQLAHDDPVRTQMVTLAKSAIALQPRMSVPASPVPPARKQRPSSKTQLPAAKRPSMASRLRERPVAATGLALVLAAIGVGGGVELARLRGLQPGVPIDSSAMAQPPAPVPAPASSTATQVAGLGEPKPETPAAHTAATPRARPVAPPLSARDRDRADREARARRDSIARHDSLARRDSSARADSLARLAAAPVPPPAPAVPDTGFVILGTHTPGAVYYINGTARGVIGGLARRTFRAGTVRLGINAEGCTAWDTTVTVRGGDTLRLGYRSPRCP